MFVLAWYEEDSWSEPGGVSFRRFNGLGTMSTFFQAEVGNFRKMKLLGTL